MPPFIYRFIPFLPPEILLDSVLHLTATGAIMLSCSVVFFVNCYLVYTYPSLQVKYWGRLYVLLGGFVFLLGIPYAFDFLIYMYWLDPLVFDLEWWQAITKLLIATLGLTAAGFYACFPIYFRRREIMHRSELERVAQHVQERFQALLDTERTEKQQLIAELAHQHIEKQQLRNYAQIVLSQRDMITDTLHTLPEVVKLAQAGHDVQTDLVLFFNDLNTRMKRLTGEPDLPSFEEIRSDLRALQTFEGQAPELLFFFVNTLRDALVVTDRSGIIHLVNDALLILSGYTRDALLQQPVELLVAEDRREAHRQYRERYVEAEPTPRLMAQNLNLSLRQVTGALVPITAHLYPYGSPTAYIFVLATRN